MGPKVFQDCTRKTKTVCNQREYNPNRNLTHAVTYHISHCYFPENGYGDFFISKIYSKKIDKKKKVMDKKDIFSSNVSFQFSTPPPMNPLLVTLKET